MSVDTTLTCRDCGQAFTFTSGEQDFYAARGYSEPSRCADCRRQRKAERESGGGGYSGGRAAREMFSATCSSVWQGSPGPISAQRRQARLLFGLLPAARGQLAAALVPADEGATEWRTSRPAPRHGRTGQPSAVTQRANSRPAKADARAREWPS